MQIKNFLTEYFAEIFIGFLGIIFSLVLYFGTFSKSSDHLLIATKAWSDFASHIPLIRSFSLGYNFPPQYPLFPNEPIKYHFVFYALVGLLEKTGIPIDVALNSLSSLGLLLLIFMIYIFAKELFKSKAVGVISVIFFFFNSSLSYLYFFKRYPISTDSINQIMTNKDFLSFAPYGQGLISAFGNLNIYTNQRHLALSLGLSLLLIYLVLKPVFDKKRLSLNQYVILGILLGLSFFLHTAVALMTFVVLICFTIAFPKIRKETLLLLIFAAVLTFPQYLYSKGIEGFSPKFYFGYLVSQPTIEKLTEFWIYNIGISLFLIPIGFFLSNKIQRKIFISFLFLFLIGIGVQLSPEIAANHKFFNYFFIVADMFCAYFIYLVWKKRAIFKPLAIAFFLFMILGGIIDIFPIINDSKVSISDYEINSGSVWIKNNTNPNSVFLNTTYLFDPASLVGRKIFIGWPYFSWSQGYNTDKRGQEMRKMLGATNKKTACNLLLVNKIDYVEIKIQNPPDPNIPIISNIYKENFSSSYTNKSTNYTIYSVANNCSE